MVVVMPACLLLFVLGWYTTVRLFSSANAVRLFEQRINVPEQSQEAPDRLRVGAYNIAHGRGLGSGNWTGEDQATRLARLDTIATLLREQELDIVVLNEVDFDSSWSHGVNQARYVAEQAGYRYWAEQRNCDLAVPWFSLRFGNAVLSRYPILDATLFDLPSFSKLETVAAGKKRGVVCTIDLGAGRKVRVLVVHLEHRSEMVRITSARRMAKLARRSEIPLIAAGDFNSTLPSFPHAQTDAQGRTAISVLMDSGLFAMLKRSHPRIDEFTFSSNDPRMVIDWVLVTTPLEVKEEHVIAVELSDHRPLIATVALPQKKQAE